MRSHRHQDPRLRRPGFLAVPETSIEQALRLLARRHRADPRFETCALQVLLMAGDPAQARAASA